MVPAKPGNFKLREGLGKLMIKNKDMSGSETLYQEAMEIDSDGANAQTARARLAGLALAAKSLDKARGWAEQALEIKPENAQALIIRGKINLMDGNSDAAIPDLRMVQRSEPGSIPAMLLLAEPQRNTGAVNLAEDNYRKVLELQPNNNVALYQSATIFAARREYEQAAVNLEKVMEQNPGNFQAVNMLAGVYTSLERWDEAEKAYNSL
jgi:Tfp pilus assembly protein PilF